MADEELIDAAKLARRRAQEAPLAEFHLDHDGHRWVGPATAWADRSREWSALMAEVDRRGLRIAP